MNTEAVFASFSWVRGDKHEHENVKRRQKALNSFLWHGMQMFVQPAEFDHRRVRAGGLPAGQELPNIRRDFEVGNGFKKQQLNN